MTNEELDKLERRISDLKTLYDNYFAGVEKREPLLKREKLLADMRRLTLTPGTLNTQTQFRFNNVRSRFATMEAHWNRMVKQSEVAGRRHRADGRPAPSPRARRSDAPPPNPLAEGTMRALYDNYISSRQLTGEAPIPFELMVLSLKKQVPALIERFKCKSVEFKVSKKDGKTIIKAVPIT